MLGKIKEMVGIKDNRKIFATETVSKIKQAVNFDFRDDIAIVFDLDNCYNPNIRVQQLASKELYQEESRLWFSNMREGIYYKEKLPANYCLKRQGYHLDKKEIDNLNAIVKYCAEEMGPLYVGFVHFSFFTVGGYGNTYETYTVSSSDGSSQTVSVSSGAGNSFGPLGVVCHRSYYDAYKHNINSKNDSFVYTKEKEKYLKKQSKGSRPW